MHHDPDFIINFFATDDTEDSAGRTLNDILRYNNQALEYDHAYIQLLFPLPEPSPFNPGAPLITAHVRDAFLANSSLRERLILALERMLQFYGFGINPSYTHPELAALEAPPEPDDERGPLIGKSINFERRAKASWLKSMDHNHLRLTRMIRSLRVLGLEVLAGELWGVLEDWDVEKRVGRRTKMFWRRAVERGLWLMPSEEDVDAVGIEWLRDDYEEDGEEEMEEGADGGGEGAVKEVINRDRSQAQAKEENSDEGSSDDDDGNDARNSAKVKA